MNIRRRIEEMEEKMLSPVACKSMYSKGREKEEEPCSLRTVFQRDRDRILHCKSFRRLKHKTQVFISPEGDHYRTRLTHTLEVSQIARTIARGLCLNEDLVEAISLGHDLGHTPFGHSGEHIINEISTLEFKHHEQSLRVVEKIENNGQGLNLTWEVRDGILNHPTAGNPSTLEGKVVQISDKIAYINHDVDDAIRGKIITEEDIPKVCRDILGKNNIQRLNCMVSDIITQSYGKEDIKMTEEIFEAMKELRKYMFSNVYIASKAKEQEKKAQNILKEIYYYYLDKPQALKKEYLNKIIREEDIERFIIDYMAGMTDRYAINLFKKLFLPFSWSIL